MAEHPYDRYLTRGNLPNPHHSYSQTPERRRPPHAESAALSELVRLANLKSGPALLYHTIGMTTLADTSKKREYYYPDDMNTQAGPAGQTKTMTDTRTGCRGRFFPQQAAA